MGTTGGATNSALDSYTPDSESCAFIGILRLHRDPARRGQPRAMAAPTARGFPGPVIADRLPWKVSGSPRLVAVSGRSASGSHLRVVDSERFQADSGATLVQPVRLGDRCRPEALLGLRLMLTGPTGNETADPLIFRLPGQQLPPQHRIHATITPEPGPPRRADAQGLLGRPNDRPKNNACIALIAMSALHYPHG
jgi:hypothetical protein